MDLTFVSMDAIVEEIKKRFDTVVILTRKQVDNEHDDIHYHFRDKLGCVGLMSVAQEGIVNGYRADETGTFD